MTRQEMRKLDVWIAENVMGYERASELKTFLPTTDPTSAMAVLEKCLEKSGYGLVLDIHDDAGFSIEHRSPHKSHATGDETLPLTISLFAKKLYINKP